MEDRYNVECCEFMHAHDEIVERVQKEMPGEDTLYDLTETERNASELTRWAGRKCPSGRVMGLANKG